MALKMFKVRILAQTAVDGLGKPYPDYLIPDYTEWRKNRDQVAALNALPVSEIGRSSKEPVGYKPIVLKRGNPVPLELVVDEEYLELLGCDKKNLSIFDRQEVVEEIPSAVTAKPNVTNYQGKGAR